MVWWPRVAPWSYVCAACSICITFSIACVLFSQRNKVSELPSPTLTFQAAQHASIASLVTSARWSKDIETISAVDHETSSCYPTVICFELRDHAARSWSVFSWPFYRKDKSRSRHTWHIGRTCAGAYQWHSWVKWKPINLFHHIALLILSNANACTVTADNGKFATKTISTTKSNRVKSPSKVVLVSFDIFSNAPPQIVFQPGAHGLVSTLENSCKLKSGRCIVFLGCSHTFSWVGWTTAF